MALIAFNTVIFFILIPAILIILGLTFIIWKFSEPYSCIFRSKKEEQYFDPAKGKYEYFPSIVDTCSIHLSVIIPAYEEQDRLPLMLDECLSFLETFQNNNKDYKYEIIIVNDGSKDKTSEVALKYVEKYSTNKVRLLELEKNRGKGGAVCMGVQSARGSVILFADADGATKFDDLVKLESALQLLIQSNYKENPKQVAESKAIICGSRAHLEKDVSAKRSLFRTLLMHGFHFLVWLFAVRSVRDTQCGFKLLTRKAARLCFRSLHITRWAFDVELLFIAEKYNIAIAEVAVRWTEIEGSKLVPFWSWLQMGRDLFLIWFRYAIGAWKLAEVD